MVESHDALFTVHGQVAAVEQMFGEDIQDDDFPVLRTQPHGAVHTTHGRNLGRAHWKDLRREKRERDPVLD